MSKMPLEELTDTLAANNFGNMSKDPNGNPFFRSHRVNIGDAGDNWILYPVSEATGDVLRKLFANSYDIEIGSVLGEVVAFDSHSLYRVDL